MAVRALLWSAFVVLAVAAPAAAAQKPEPSAAKQTPRFVLMKPLWTRLDQEILAAFEGEDALKSALLADLKPLHGEKDAKRRSAAIEAFQAKHGKEYRRVLAKGRVDLTRYAAEMQRVDRASRYRVVDGLYIIGGPPPEKPRKESPPPPPPPPPEDTYVPPEYIPPARDSDRAGSHVIAVGDFTFEGSRTCGHEVTAVSGRTQSTVSESTVSGLCKATAKRIFEFKRNPAGGVALRSFRVDADGSGEVHVIGGVLGADAHAEIHVMAIGEGGSFPVKIDKYSYSSVHVGPFFTADDWIGSSGYSPFGPYHYDIDQGEGYVAEIPARNWRFEVTTYGETDTAGGWAEASAKLKLIEVELYRQVIYD